MVRIQRNVRLGETRQSHEALAKKALREFVDRVNNYEPVALKSRTMGNLQPSFGKLAMGALDSEGVQKFLNTLMWEPTKTVKNVWATLRIMWKSALAWNYVTGELRVELPKSRKLRMRLLYHSGSETHSPIRRVHGRCSFGSQQKQGCVPGNSLRFVSMTRSVALCV